MQYATFKITEEKEINAFLRENKQKIARDGVAFLDGSICILYEERSPGQTERDLAVDAAQLYINTQLSEAMGHELDIRCWRSLKLKNVKNADVEISMAEGKKENCLLKVRAARAVMLDIKNKKLEGLTE